MHQSTTPSLSQTIWPRWASRLFLSLPRVETLVPVTFGYSLSSEAIVMRQLRRWKGLWRRSLACSHKRTSIWPPRSCWNGTTSALQSEEITSKETRVSCVYPYEKSLETYRMQLVVTQLPCQEQDVTQGHFLSGVQLVWIKSFFFSSIGCSTKLKKSQVCFAVYL